MASIFKRPGVASVPKVKSSSSGTSTAPKPSRQPKPPPKSDHPAFDSSDDDSVDDADSAEWGNIAPAPKVFTRNVGLPSGPGRAALKTAPFPTKRMTNASQMSNTPRTPSSAARSTPSKGGFNDPALLPPHASRAYSDASTERPYYQNQAQTAPESSLYFAPPFPYAHDNYARSAETLQNRSPPSQPYDQNGRWSPNPSPAIRPVQLNDPAYSPKQNGSPGGSPGVQYESNTSSPDMPSNVSRSASLSTDEVMTPEPAQQSFGNVPPQIYKNEEMGQNAFAQYDSRTGQEEQYAQPFPQDADEPLTPGFDMITPTQMRQNPQSSARSSAKSPLRNAATLAPLPDSPPDDGALGSSQPGSATTSPRAPSANLLPISDRMYGSPQSQDSSSGRPQGQSPNFGDGSPEQSYRPELAPRSQGSMSSPPPTTHLSLEYGRSEQADFQDQNGAQYAPQGYPSYQEQRQDLDSPVFEMVGPAAHREIQRAGAGGEPYSRSPNVNAQRNLLPEDVMPGRQPSPSPKKYQPPPAPPSRYPEPPTQPNVYDTRVGNNYNGNTQSSPMPFNDMVPEDQYSNLSPPRPAYQESGRPRDSSSSQNTSQFSSGPSLSSFGPTPTSSTPSSSFPMTPPTASFAANSGPGLKPQYASGPVPPAPFYQDAQRSYSAGNLAPMGSPWASDPGRNDGYGGRPSASAVSAQVRSLNATAPPEPPVFEMVAGGPGRSGLKAPPHPLRNLQSPSSPNLQSSFPSSPTESSGRPRSKSKIRWGGGGGKSDTEGGGDKGSRKSFGW